MTVCMSLMVVHYSNELHSRKEAHTTAPVRGTQTVMLLYGKAVVFGGYENGPSAKGSIHIKQ